MRHGGSTQAGPHPRGRPFQPTARGLGGEPSGDYQGDHGHPCKPPEVGDRPLHEDTGCRTCPRWPITRWARNSRSRRNPSEDGPSVARHASASFRKCRHCTHVAGSTGPGRSILYRSGTSSNHLRSITPPRAVGNAHTGTGTGADHCRAGDTPLPNAYPARHRTDPTNRLENPRTGFRAYL